MHSYEGTFYPPFEDAVQAQIDAADEAATEFFNIFTTALDDAIEDTIARLNRVLDAEELVVKAEDALKESAFAYVELLQDDASNERLDGGRWDLSDYACGYVDAVERLRKVRAEALSF